MKLTVQGLIELARVAAGDDPARQAEWLERQLPACRHAPTKGQLEMAVAQLRIRAAKRVQEAPR